MATPAVAPIAAAMTTTQTNARAGGQTEPRQPRGAEAAQTEDDEGTDRGTEHDADEDVQPRSPPSGTPSRKSRTAPVPAARTAQDDDGDPDDERPTPRPGGAPAFPRHAPVQT